MKATTATSLSILLEPADNQRLANLCGILDENLRQIEAALDNVIAHAHDEEIAPLCSASPWLAARSEREIPQWIAAEAQRRLAR